MALGEMPRLVAPAMKSSAEQNLLEVVKRPSMARTKSQPEILEGIEQIWTSHINKKPIMAKSRRARKYGIIALERNSVPPNFDMNHSVEVLPQPYVSQIPLNGKLNGSVMRPGDHASSLYMQKAGVESLFTP